MAKNGFEVTAIDFSERAIEYAKITPLGTELFYYDQEEMRGMFESKFEIIDASIMPLMGQRGVSQPGNFFLLRKPSQE